MYHLVDVVRSDDQTFQNVRALAGFPQVKLGAAYHHVVAVLDEAGNAVLEREQFRPAVYQCDAVDGEGGLEGRHLEELVQHDVGVVVALHVDDNAHAVLVALVVDVRDALNALFGGQHTDVLHEFLLVQSVGELVDDDGVVLWPGLDVGLGTHDYTSTSCLVSRTHALHAHDVAACREVRSLDMLHEFVDGDVGIVNVGHAAVNHLAQVVGRHIGSHSDCNAAGTVHQEVRDACRHHCGLVERIVKVAVHVDRFLLQILHHGLAHLCEPGFGVTHGGGGVAVHRTEVTLSVDQGVAHVPGLGHTDQCPVHRAVAVGVIFTEHVAHNTGRLTGRFVVGDAQSHHAVENAAVNGLESVANIGQRTCHDDRHGVVNIGGLHFLLNIDFDNSVFVFDHYIGLCVCAVRLVASNGPVRPVLLRQIYAIRIYTTNLSAENRGLGRAKCPKRPF